jgi:hypothetical protein
MRWLRENKGDAASLVFAAIMLCLIVGLVFKSAEAVIGGPGTFGADTNHPHDFTPSSGGVRASSEDEICIYCHTPHHAHREDSILNAPLWNHKLSSQASYTVKTASTYFTNATIGNLTLQSSPPTSPDGASRLCLSCHDGTVSIGAIYSRADISIVADSCIDASGYIKSTCSAYIGVDLTTKHVVSIPMNDDLITASVTNCVLPNTTQLKYPWTDSGAGDAQEDTVILRPVGPDKKYNDKLGVTRSSGKYQSGYNYGVQCSTCHDPHYWVELSGPVDTEGEYFLVTAFNDLCKACHYVCT